MKAPRRIISILFSLVFSLNSVAYARPVVDVGGDIDPSDPPIIIRPREGQPYCQSGCGPNRDPRGLGDGRGTGNSGSSGTGGDGRSDIPGIGNDGDDTGGSSGNGNRDRSESIYSRWDRSISEMPEEKAWMAYKEEVEFLNNKWGEEFNHAYETEKGQFETSSNLVDQWANANFRDIEIGEDEPLELRQRIAQSIPPQLSGYQYLNYDDNQFKSLREHTFQSDHKDELDKIRSDHAKFRPSSPQAYRSYQAGLMALVDADKAYVNQEYPVGDFLKEAGKLLLDFATDIIPMTSIPKDLYRTFVGKDPFSGNKISGFERIMAGGFVVLALMSFGTSNFLKGIKEVKVIAGATAEEARVAEKALEQSKMTGELERIAAAPDKWSRTPKSIQDQMALEAAKRDEGKRIMMEVPLNDPKFKDMHKMQLKVKSDEGRESVIHYIKNPETGELMDFKFKKHSVD